VSAPHSAHAHDAVASAWVTRFASLVTAGGRVLDLACGRGRHARLFAARGCPVVAIDRDAAALAAIRDIEGVTPIVADLESAPWPTEMGRFDAIVVTNYLHRALFPNILGVLADDGIVIYETFARGNERYGKPSNPDYLLAPGELLAQIGATLTVIAFEQGMVGGATPSVIERIAAVGPARAWPPPIP
jgi:SAM-dependent methyltransferase